VGSLRWLVSSVAGRFGGWSAQWPLGSVAVPVSRRADPRLGRGPGRSRPGRGPGHRIDLDPGGHRPADRSGHRSQHHHLPRPRIDGHPDQDHRTCWAPGCQIPATGTDLDHTTEWAPHPGGGPATETNLVALHRGHHNLKTNRFWDSTQTPDGTLIWTTATGATHTTYPYTYDHPDNTPITGSTLEHHLGHNLAQILNPPSPDPAS
jgi:hypothetical protein